MRFYEVTDGEYILAYGVSDHTGQEIPEERYRAILDAISNMPPDTGTVSHRLKTNLAWESYEIEPVDPDITDGEAFAIIFGGGE